VANVLDLAYEFQLPTGIKYIDHEAAPRPIDLELHNESVRGILQAIVQVPEYQVIFSDGVVDVYVRKAREDSSNLLNKLIKNFAVSELDTQRANMELFCALSHELRNCDRGCALCVTRQGHGEERRESQKSVGSKG
jgi:hypothetical protein